MNIKIGINSPQIKDFGGTIDPCEVEIIELGLDRVDFLDKQKEKELLSKAKYLASSFGTEFTIHAPHIDSRIEGIKIDFYGAPPSERQYFTSAENLMLGLICFDTREAARSALYRF